ncbi:MAG: lycopene cyclase family protein [Bacteroidota bacterium]
MSDNHYDYIFAGGGAAALSLLVRMQQEGLLRDKKVLVIDKDKKEHNDRTWCFWEEKEGLFESCVVKTWDKIRFASPGYDAKLNPQPYKYKMIRSQGFYQYCNQIISQNSHIHFVQDMILNFENNKVITLDGRYTGNIIFNSSIQFLNKDESRYHYFLQHFKGKFIETEQPYFEEGVATLMDFTIDQHNECRFMYILPVSKTKALMEFTVFSENLLEKEEYETELNNYIDEKLKYHPFKVTEEEFGVIPMYNQPFIKKINPHVFNIGTNGGASKASTGFTFHFIQEESKQLIAHLKKHPTLSNYNPKSKGRFQFYDYVFLRVLREKKVPAFYLFNCMFRKLPAYLPLKFLSEETSMLEDLKILSLFQTLFFFKAAFVYLIKQPVGGAE